jgi:hypothetical protein
MHSTLDLDGVWEPVVYQSLESTFAELERSAAKQTPPWLLAIRGGCFRVMVGEYIAAQGTLTIDGFSHPTSVDFVYRDHDKVLGVQRSVCCFNCDQLIIAIAGLDADRPLGFKCPPSRSDIYIISYKKRLLR